MLAFAWCCVWACGTELLCNSVYYCLKTGRSTSKNAWGRATGHNAGESGRKRRLCAFACAYRRLLAYLFDKCKCHTLPRRFLPELAPFSPVTLLICTGATSQQWEVTEERIPLSFAARLGWLCEAHSSPVTESLFLGRWVRNRTHILHTPSV